jgi:polyribonucleotide 5'-hydroxyl-kinase
VPGAISVAPVHTPLPTCSPANPLGSAATSAPTVLSSNALLPLVYWYGHPETKRNPLLMDRLIRNMGENINEKLDVDPEGTWDCPLIILYLFLRSCRSTGIRVNRRHAILLCLRTC